MNISSLGKNRHGRTPFTPELWMKWREARKPGADTMVLRAGIQEMRGLLAQRDRLREPYSRKRMLRIVK